MVLWKMTYYIDKDKQEEYRKFAQEVSIPYWTSVPGMTEMRAYVQNGSTQLLVEMEFESGEAWGKAWDDPKTKEMSAKFSKYIHGFKWSLWDASPRMPKPIRP